MFLSIIIPLMYLYKKSQRRWLPESKDRGHPVSQVEPNGDKRKTPLKPLPINDMFQSDIYGNVTDIAEVHNWPYGQGDVCHINPRPTTFEEYYSYKPTFLRSKESNTHPVIPTIKKFIDDDDVDGRRCLFTDPYVGKPETDEDRRRRAEWDYYCMDYTGADSFDNIMAKLNETLHEPQYHPHTYLPLNEEIPFIAVHPPYCPPPQEH